jgi:arylsulfatase
MKLSLTNILCLAALATQLHASPTQARNSDQSKPNIVVIMPDDVSPFDVSAYHRGLGGVMTPNIDRLAKEGMMVSDYYAQPSCTGGRAAFITGQYPIRTGLTSVGQPGSTVGLQDEDVTLAELLKGHGYATGHFGKSHLGDRNEFLSTVHGFDEFFGFLYHLNMMEMPAQPEFPKDPDFAGRPRNVIYSRATDRVDPTVHPRWGRVGKQVIEERGTLLPERMKTFDDEVFDASIDWLKRTKETGKPFLLWFNPTRMHQQTHVSDEWAGKSGHTVYADGLLQLDALVGDLLDALDEMGMSDNTIVLFTSDNGANLQHWPDSGVGGPFRGSKGLTWDGGFRVPMLVRWPGHVPAGGWTGEFMTSEDWLPTLMAAVGEDDVKEKLLVGHAVGESTFKVHLDGYDQTNLIKGTGPSNRREFFFFGENDLNAVRVDQWKIHLAIKDSWIGTREKLSAGMIIDIKLDPFERTPETPGHFLWMKEKTWILPIIAPPLVKFAKSMKTFPPRQKGTGIGAAAMLSMLDDKGASD